MPLGHIEKSANCKKLKAKGLKTNFDVIQTTVQLNWLAFILITANAIFLT
jgi:hypothetical protein